MPEGPIDAWRFFKSFVLLSKRQHGCRNKYVDIIVILNDIFLKVSWQKKKSIGWLMMLESVNICLLQVPIKKTLIGIKLQGTWIRRANYFLFNILLKLSWTGRSNMWVYLQLNLIIKRDRRRVYTIVFVFLQRNLIIPVRRRGVYTIEIARL